MSLNVLTRITIRFTEHSYLLFELTLTFSTTLLG
jgi:hypothetical protein